MKLIVNFKKLWNNFVFICMVLIFLLGILAVFLYSCYYNFIKFLLLIMTKMIFRVYEERDAERPICFFPNWK